MKQLWRARREGTNSGEKGEQAEVKTELTLTTAASGINSDHIRKPPQRAVRNRCIGTHAHTHRDMLGYSHNQKIHQSSPVPFETILNIWVAARRTFIGSHKHQTQHICLYPLSMHWENGRYPDYHSLYKCFFLGLLLCGENLHII